MTLDFNRRPDECNECGGPLECDPAYDKEQNTAICDKCFLLLVEVEGHA